MRTFVLHFDQVLFIPTMDHNLLCVDQMREHGVLVNDIPLVRLPPDQRSHESHSLVIHGDSSGKVAIPLQFDKPISYFEIRKPTRDEVLGDDCTHFYLTGSIPWEPYDEATTRQEIALRRENQDQYRRNRWSPDRNRGK